MSFFRKPLSDKFGYPHDNQIDYTFDYKSVMQFISRNKIIPEKIAAFSSCPFAQTDIELLKNAIKTGELSHEIFYHSDCQLYSLYLLKEKTISIEDFLTLNMYLIALMQCSTKQRLADVDENEKEEENKIKKSFEIDYTSIDFVFIKDKFIRALNNVYFNQHYTQKLDINEFNNAIDQLSELGKTVIIIDTEPHPDQPFIDLMKEFADLSPLMTREKKVFYIPSASLMALLLKAINKQYSVKMAPIFGSVNVQTLFQLHQRGLHPVSLYSPFVKTNPVTIHDVRCGPLPALLHDAVAHVYFGNLLHQNDYLFVYEYLMPKVAALNNMRINQMDPDFFQLVDLDIAEESFIEKNEKFYLHACLQRVMKLDCHMHQDQIINVLTLISHIQNDQEMLKIKYQFDLEETLKDPIFNHEKLQFKGEMILEIIKQMREERIGALAALKCHCGLLLNSPTGIRPY